MHCLAKRHYNLQKSALFTYERSSAIKYFSTEWLRPVYGLLEVIKALETSAKHIGVKMYPSEKVNALKREGGMFEIRTDHFLASAKKLIIAVPVAPLEEITGDVALGIKKNSLFKPIIGRACFKAVAIYEYPRWENATFPTLVGRFFFFLFQKYFTSESSLGPTDEKESHEVMELEIKKSEQ